MPDFTYQWQRDDSGDIAGQSGNVFIPVPGNASKEYTPVSDDIGHKVRLHANDGVADYYSPWSDAVADLPVPPSGSILPAPPNSYSDTGTVTWTSKIATSTASIYALFHPTWQKIVRTSSGKIFVVIQTSDNGEHYPSSWTLFRSDNDGASWTQVWNSTAKGDPQYGICPALEIDENENIYVIANYYPRAGATGYNGLKMYKFLASNNYSSSITPVNLPSSNSSGKYSVFLDQTRGWIWILHWAFSGLGTNLQAYDYNGVLKYSRNVFKAFTRKWSPTQNGSTDLHGAPHYPCIYVNVDGIVFLAWNTLAAEGGDFTNASLSYYDVRMVYSQSSTAAFEAHSETWIGPANGITGSPSARSLPFAGDDSGQLSERGFLICKTSNQDEFIPASDSGYGFDPGKKYNFNRLMSIAYNNGALHFYYESETSDTEAIKHHSYANINLSTHTISDVTRRTPEWHYDTNPPTGGNRAGNAGGAGGGSYSQATTMEDRLYFGQVNQVDGKAIRILNSDDGGDSWYRYALSSNLGAGSNGLLNVQLSRFVGSDGIIPGLAAYADSPNEIYAFLVTPD